MQISSISKYILLKTDFWHTSTKRLKVATKITVNNWTDAPSLSVPPSPSGFTPNRSFIVAAFLIRLQPFQPEFFQGFEILAVII
jgi:hypothetical protein